MNERTKDLIVAAAKAIASKPLDVFVTERDSKYEINGHPRDIGKFIGKTASTVLAIEVLARQLDSEARVQVCRLHQPFDSSAYALGLRSDWSQEEEHRLKESILSILRFIYPDANVVLQLDIRRSVYVVMDTQVIPDVVGALNVIFRGIGRRRGRNIDITLPTNTSEL